MPKQPVLLTSKYQSDALSCVFGDTNTKNFLAPSSQVSDHIFDTSFCFELPRLLNKALATLTADKPLWHCNN